MPGTVIEYARFVEVQRRRARIRTEFERPAIAPEPLTAPGSLEPFIDVGQSLTSVDASTTCGTVDVR